MSGYKQLAVENARLKKQVQMLTNSTMTLTHNIVTLVNEPNSHEAKIIKERVKSIETPKEKKDIWYRRLFKRSKSGLSIGETPVLSTNS